jgi:hypothetical protein
VSDLEIPERAYRAYSNAYPELLMQISDEKIRQRTVIDAASPIIVAAELRRMAADPDNEYLWTEGGVYQLLTRADELDPPEERIS